MQDSLKISKNINGEKSYDICIEKDKKKLRFMFGGNLDLYISVSNGRLIPENENTIIYFDITKENYEIFSSFDELYNNIIDGKVFGEDTDYNNHSDFKNSYEYNKLVDENKNITWISDDGLEEVEDMVSISKLDEDTYRLKFIRNDKEMDFGFKSNTSISVRFRNSGSRYGYFHCPFMIMFQKLQNIDPDYHQIHFEEVMYEKRLAKKKYSTQR